MKRAWKWSTDGTYKVPTCARCRAGWPFADGLCRLCMNEAASEEAAA